MSLNPSLRLGFDLPFAVRLTNGQSSQPLRIEVTATHDLQELDLRRIEAHIQVFVSAALFGMGAGKNVQPQFASNMDVIEVLSVYDRSPTAASITCEARVLELDLNYISILLHKLLCLTHYFVPIGHIAVQAPITARPIGIVELSRGKESDLPDLARSIPFPFHANLEHYSGSLVITVEFQSSLDETQSALLKRGCNTWLAQCAQGGFISPTYGVEEFFISSNEVSIAGAALEWELDKIQVDSRALNGLVNLFVAFSERFVPVTMLAIE